MVLADVHQVSILKAKPNKENSPKKKKKENWLTSNSFWGVSQKAPSLFQQLEHATKSVHLAINHTQSCNMSGNISFSDYLTIALLPYIFPTSSHLFLRLKALWGQGPIIIIIIFLPLKWSSNVAR